MFWTDFLEILDARMETPTCYGWFHILSLVLMILLTFYLCTRRKQDSADRVRHIVLGVSILVLILEVYKQINYSFSYADGKIVYDFQWYAFPFQFCSTPMYVGLLAGLIKKGKIHDALCAYLATYAVFAGLCVMIYPGDVFISTIGINIQTMICHGVMIPIGAYLFATGHVKLETKTILKAIPVFSVAVLMAMTMNEIAHASGLLERETFNMFYFSPYCDPSLPVYSIVQGIIPYPWSLIIYIAGFSAAAFLMLLGTMGIHKLYCKLSSRKSSVVVSA